MSGRRPKRDVVAYILISDLLLSIKVIGSQCSNIQLEKRKLVSNCNKHGQEEYTSNITL